MPLYLKFRTKKRSYKSDSSNRKQQQRRRGRAITIRSRSNKERSGSTKTQIKRLVVTYITLKTATAVIKQMRRALRTMRAIKTRGQPSGGSCS
jgi:hypothetical protein